VSTTVDLSDDKRYFILSKTWQLGIILK